MYDSPWRTMCNKVLSSYQTLFFGQTAPNMPSSKNIFLIHLQFHPYNHIVHIDISDVFLYASQDSPLLLPYIHIAHMCSYPPPKNTKFIGFGPLKLKN